MIDLLRISLPVVLFLGSFFCGASLGNFPDPKQNGMMEVFLPLPGKIDELETQK